MSFNTAMATPTNWSATSIAVPVPSGATTGNVTVTVAGQTSNAVLFTVTAPTITVAITPVRGGVTVTQQMTLTATLQDDPAGAGVTWSASGGTLSNQMAFDDDLRGDHGGLLYDYGNQQDRRDEERSCRHRRHRSHRCEHLAK